MEKEKPILLSDLIPPEEIDSYVPEPEDVIPIRTWSRGNPFDLDGGFEFAFQGRHGSVGNSQNSDGTNGMLNYTAIQQVFDGQEVVDEEDEDEENGDEEEVDDGGEYPEDYENDEEFIPNYNTVNQGSALLAEDEGSLEADYDNYFDKEGQEEAGEGVEEGEESEGEYEEEEEEGDEQYGEEDDEVNYDNGDDVEYGDAPGGFDIDNEHFEKVVLSPRDMELIASSGPSGEVNDLVDIMNEYNELVNYLASPRGPAKKAGPAGKVKPAAAKVPAPPRQPKAVPLPVKRRILPGSDSEDGSEEGDSDMHSASSQALLAREKLSILTGMVGAAGVSKGSAPTQNQTGVAKKPPPRKKVSNEAKKKPKKKLFGQALEDQKALAIQLKLVGRSEVDNKHKVCRTHTPTLCDSYYLPLTVHVCLFLPGNVGQHGGGATEG